VKLGKPVSLWARKRNEQATVQYKNDVNMEINALPLEMVRVEKLAIKCKK
jgi:hypothetical protein